MPRGGPDGGAGGRGGDVILRVDPNLNTLRDFRYRTQYRAEKGAHGRGANRNGRHGESLILRVPPGTAVYDLDTFEQIADLVDDCREVVGAAGGRGGRGNASFANAVNRAPRRAEDGQPGQARRLRLELKLIADAGLVGFPNAGKSTLLARATAAQPRIAPYPFTTLEPQLGVVSLEDDTFILADLPGLIEGAHEGAGLGHRFLRHAERSGLLICVVDCSETADPEPLAALRLLLTELSRYEPDLSGRALLLAANKLDLPGANVNIERLIEGLKDTSMEVFPVSAATGEGVEILMTRILRMLRNQGRFEGEEGEEGREHLE